MADAAGGIDLAKLFLNIAENTYVAQLKTHMGEGLVAPAGRAAGAAAGTLREVADIPADLEAVNTEGDPLKAYFALVDLKRRLSAVDPNGLTPAGARELRLLTERLQAKHDRVLSRWDEPTRTAVQRFGQLMVTARDCLEDLLARIEGRDGESESSSTISLTAQVNTLSGLLAEMDALARQTPTVHLKSAPEWEMLMEAQRGIVDPHRRNVFLYKCAVLMTHADGELSSVERDFLYAISHLIRLTRTEADDLVVQAAPIRPSEFEGSPEEAHDLVHKLYLCALADGVVTESEKRMLQRVARSLGVPEETVFDILSEGHHESSISFLESDAVREFLVSQGGLPKNTLAGEDVPAERLREMRAQLRIPKGEDILLAYENRFLDKLVECAALTGGRLFLSGQPGTRETVELSQIEGCRPAVRSAVLDLRNGRNVRMSRSAEPFLKLVVACLQENLRHL